MKSSNTTNTPETKKCICRRKPILHSWFPPNINEKVLVHVVCKCGRSGPFRTMCKKAILDWNEDMAILRMRPNLS